jgi:hypothetical protein
MRLMYEDEDEDEDDDEDEVEVVSDAEGKCELL